MSSAAIELQRAVYRTLTTDDGVAAAMGGDAGNIFDKVPDDIMQAFAAGTAPTYVTLGEGQARHDLYGDPGSETDTVDVVTHTLVFHVWSQTVGLLQAKMIAQAIIDALRAAFASNQFNLAGQALMRIDPVSETYDRDRDGFTSHAALVMSALTQPAT